jgi:hypothetical protein
MLVGALLLTATLRNLAQVDLGFDPDRVTTAAVRPASVGLMPDAAFAYYAGVLERLAARPGIEAVSLAYDAPFAGGGRTFQGIRRAGDPPEDSFDVAVTQVLSPDYFRTLNIRVQRGRPFAGHEISMPIREGGPRAVMLSAALARRLFGTIDAVGQFVEFRQKGRAGRHEVVGVTSDVRLTDLTGDPPPVLFDPVGLGLAGTFGLAGTYATVIVRAQPQVDAAAEIRRATAEVNASVPVTILPLTQAVERARVEWDVLAWLMVAVAGVATVLSAVGVYGLVAFGAAERRREFGIRSAFGCSPALIRRLVLRRASALTMAALVFGLAGAVALARVLESRLVGVQPFDPAIWTASAIALVVIVLVASMVPARRAARVNPADTLRAL